MFICKIKNINDIIKIKIKWSDKKKLNYTLWKSYKYIKNRNKEIWNTELHINEMI